MFEKWKEKSALKKISAFRDIDGWLTDQEAWGLYHIAHKLNRDATVVEIGSWQGKSTYCIAKGLSSGTIYAIDPFNADGGMDTGSQDEYNRKGDGKDLLQSFTAMMERLGVRQMIKVKKGYSYEFYNDFSNIDFLFIDGDHSIEGCKKDFDLYAEKVVAGGYIAFHDYYGDRPELGPTYVIERFVVPSAQFKFYGKYDSLWVAQKLK